MAKRRHTPEQVIKKLREAEVAIAEGSTVAEAARSIRSADVMEALAELMVFRGVPDHIRSDNGPEFTARAVREWLGRVGVRTLYIEPGSPWENGLRVSTGS